MLSPALSAEGKQTEADQLRLQSGAVGEQKTALATELAPVIEEWAKIAQVQVDAGNTAGAQASIARAEKFLGMAEGLGSEVPLDTVRETVAQVKGKLAGGAAPDASGTQATRGEGDMPPAKEG